MLSKPQKINQEYFSQINNIEPITLEILKSEKTNTLTIKENPNEGDIRKVEEQVFLELLKEGVQWFSVKEDVIRKCFNHSGDAITLLNEIDLSRYERMNITVVPKLLKIESSSFCILYQCLELRELQNEKMDLLMAIKNDLSRSQEEVRGVEEKEKMEGGKKEKRMYDRFEREKRDMRDKIQELRIKATLYKIEAEKLEEEYNETFA